MTYRAELSGRALKQMHGLPGPAFDSLIETMAQVIDYPGDPLRTFPTSDPYIRRVEFGDAGLITYLINDGASLIIILDITWAGLATPLGSNQRPLACKRSTATCQPGTIVGGTGGNKYAKIRGSPRVSAVIFTQLVTQQLALGWLCLTGALDT